MCTQNIFVSNCRYIHTYMNDLNYFRIVSINSMKVKVINLNANKYIEAHTHVYILIHTYFLASPTSIKNNNLIA